MSNHPKLTQCTDSAAHAISSKKATERNEGSTKPTYSELEAENLRVRGLLQRQSDALQLCAKALRMFAPIRRRQAMNEADEAAINALFAVESLPKGAESADIGKLDRVDNEVYGKIAKHFRGRINCTYTPEQVARCIEELRDKKFVKCAGSAETGGEKADHD